MAAQTWTWDGSGTNDNWTTAANWTSNRVPVNDGTADIIFGGSTALTANLDAPFNIRSLTFDNTAGAFSLVSSTNSQLTIQLGGITNNRLLQSQTINHRVAVAVHQTWTAAAGNLTFGGGLSGPGALTLVGPHVFTFSGDNSGMTGHVNVNSGRLELRNSDAIGDQSTLTVAANATVDLNGFDETFGGLAGGGTVEGGGAVLSIGANNLDTTFSGDINSTALRKIGTGRLTLTLNDFHYSPTVVEAGVLQLGDGGMNGFIPSGSITSHGELVYDRSDTLSQLGAVHGTGRVVHAGTGILDLVQPTANQSTYTGGLAILRGTVWTEPANEGSASGAGAGGPITLGGPATQGTLVVREHVPLPDPNSGVSNRAIVLTGGGGVIRHQLNKPFLNLSGPITGDGSLDLRDLILSHANNTYTGPTTISGVVHAAAPGALGTNSAVTLNVTSSLKLFDANTNAPFPQTIGSLHSASNLFLVAPTVDLGGATLTIGSDNTDATYRGVIHSSINAPGLLVKVGTGTQTLAANPNSIDAPVRIDQGTMEVGAPNQFGAAANLTLNGGPGDATLRIVKSGTTGIGIHVQSGRGVFDVQTGQSVQVTGDLDAAANGLVKRGAGEVSFYGDVRFTGDATIEAGTLGFLTGLTDPGGPIAVAGGATLKVAGRVNRFVSGPGNILAAGELFIGVFATTGFEFPGTLDVNSRNVTLVDNDMSTLNSATLAGGLLGSVNGLELTNLLTGFGRIGGIFKNSGTVTGTDAGVELSGYVHGAGSFLGNVTFTGIYSPGNSPAVVSLGSPTFAGELVMELAGATPGTHYDQLAITGTATFGGELDIDLVGGFTPGLGGQFELATYANRQGEFDVVSLPALAAGLNWAIHYGDTALTLSVTAGLPGDIDLDGDVDRADAALFAPHLGATVGSIWTTGDFDGDAATTLADLALLQSNFGATVPSPGGGLTAVPEPASLTWALIGAVGVLYVARSANRRGRSSRER